MNPVRHILHDQDSKSSFKRVNCYQAVLDVNILQKPHNLLFNLEAILKRQLDIFTEQTSKRADMVF